MGSPGAPRQRVVAAFDFDGTLTKKDTLVPFVAKFAGYPKTLAAVVAAGFAGLRRDLSPTNRDELKEFMVERLLSGHSERELQRAGGEYSAELIDSALRPEVVKQLQQHVGSGHTVVFVSASLIYYLEPIARYFAVEKVIAVEPIVVDGTITGEMPANVRAGEKERLLRLWLGESETGPLADTELWSYGNSSGDHELLQMANRAFWLGSESKRPSYAEQFTSVTAVR